MRVLAFDPGYERLGVAVVEKEKIGGKEKLLHSECVRTSSKLPFPERLGDLAVAALALIDTWEPTCVALEKIYFENNAKTAMQVAQVVGMLTQAATAAGLPIHQYTPLQVKAAITGYGKSDKRAVATMLGRLVSVPTGKRLDDEMDAIAVGITCLASVR
jgi:crossover junction endodeoxyribonuclease RuvC